MTQGWHSAWDSAVSPHAIAAETAQDDVAGVNFARNHDLRLVVKGTGHDYLGRSNAPDPLLVWTHRMNSVKFHVKFRPSGSFGPTRTALSVAAGVRWLAAYRAAAESGHYVRGGGCTSVGASGGFIQGSGFGSFSKRFGTGAGGVLEFEVVTADGRIRLANATRNSDLFWALRGGGGGTWGVVTRTTLLAHPMPESMGVVGGIISAADDQAFRELLLRLSTSFRSVNNPGWGEQITVRGANP
jgi:FAD/FMN-containing dehydrogenase